MDTLTEFENYLQAQDHSPLTTRGYLADINHFAIWFRQTNGEPLTPQVVTPTDVREYRQYLLTNERRKASTVNRRLAAISAYIDWAKQAGLIDHDPTVGVKNVPQVPGGPKYLDRRQQYALGRTIEKDLQLSKMRYPKRWISRRRDASLVLFLLHTGLRLQESLDLLLGDIEITDRKGQIIVRQGKGRKQSSVPLNADARKALQEWLAVRPQSSDAHLWVAIENSQADGLSSRSVQRVIRRLGQDAGIMDLTPHVLRHTFGKNLIDKGAGLEKVAALLGHSSLNTTRVYVTPNQHDLEQAVDMLAQDL